MGRRAKPPKKNAEAKRPLAGKPPKDEGANVRDLEKRLAEALKREAEALEQQTATGDILRIISTSPTDLQPVLEAVVSSAARFCGAYDSSIFEVHGDHLRTSAHYGPIPTPIGFSVPIVRGTVTGRSLLERRAVHVADLTVEAEEFPEGSALAKAFGQRTVVSAPLLREGAAIGTIALRRLEVKPFTDKQIALLQTFADQAVIAIENVRLFKELGARNSALTESLEQQTATGEILRVISSSPTDVQPVFDTIVQNAMRLCDAVFGRVFRRRGDTVLLAANANFPDELGHHPAPLNQDTLSGGVISSGQLHLSVDVESDPAIPPLARETFRHRGVRSILTVPMLREGQAIGAISVGHRNASAFTDAHVALLQTFADQAVIAIENVRLFTELGARNRDLTATSEILRVISSSPTDVQPVFDAVAVSAAALCGAVDALIMLVDGGTMRRVAHFGAIASVSDGRPVTSATPTGRAIVERRVIHNHDILEEFARGDYLEARRLQEATGFRTVLSVPLIREENVIGVITIRRLEVRPFTEEQIALVKTFADQAVIAIENVRLFTELEARNRDLTTTGEILRVISSSPTDVQPVFDAIARNARRLLGGHTVSVIRLVGDELHLMAFNATDAAADAVLQGFFPTPVDRFAVIARLMRDRTPVIVTDMDIDPEVAGMREIGRARGWRSVLWMPMIRDEASIGMIAVARRDPGPFADSEVALLKTFADQAVIAVENVRLFTELQTSNRELTTALDTQTATSDILRVISRSQTEVQPVFDAILASALRLLGGYSGGLTRIAGDQITLVAFTSTDPAGDAVQRAMFPQPLHSERPHGQAIRSRAPFNVADAQEDPRLPGGVRFTALARGFRSVVAVPLLRHEEPLGAIAVTRREPGGFTDDEIALLQTFADQAVIAIENVRLFKELEARNRDLTDALDQQTATSELLKVIGRSTFDLQPVFETLVENARRLCEAERAFVHRFDGQVLRVVATHNVTPELRAFVEQNPFPVGRDTVMALSGLERRTIHIHDVQSDPEITYPGNVIEPVRTALAVPMLRAAELLGVMMVYRHEVRPFSDGQIALLETFADQAAIAIENARLLSELQARTHELTRSVEQLTALGDVGRAVSSSLDLDTVLTTIVGRAVHLSGTDGGTIFEYDEDAEEFSPRATLNADESQFALLRATRLRRGEGAVGQMAVTREPLQIPDIAAEGAYESRLRGALLEAGTRAVLAIPLLHEERIVGGLVVTRRTPGAFTTEIVEILRTFATQSALAIQNARLFREIERKSRELEVASQHKSEFLANMSHELRTPLNAIIGFSEVLTERMFGELNEKQDEYLRDIYASGQHLLSLINDILDLSKIEAGRMELELTDFDLPTALENALTLVRERAGRRGIALGQTVDEGLGQIRGDERKVKQVLLNLLSNALKFTLEGGRVEVSASVVDAMAEISVTDTGVGIAPEDQAAIFEEFRQVGTAAKKVEGTGLGLALSRKFVELHGGRIWVQSQVGEGSTFTFTLPVRRDEMGA